MERCSRRFVRRMKLPELVEKDVIRVDSGTECCGDFT